MDDNGLRRLYTWIDANCPYYGTYANTRPGTPGSRDLRPGPVADRNNPGGSYNSMLAPLVWRELVAEPVALRYAWARNPLGNLVNSQHHERILPVPSFRTDGWHWGDAPFGPDGRNEVRRRRAEMRRKAEEHLRQRKLEEARALLKRLEAEAAGSK